MNGLNFIKRVGVDCLKGIAVALVSFAGMVIAGMVTRMLGLPAVGVPAYVNITKLMPLMFLTWILLASLLGECFQRLYPRYWQRVLGIWLCHYLLYYTLNTLDGILFVPMPNMSISFLTGLITSFFTALAVAWLWKPKAGALEPVELRQYFAARKTRDWVVRLTMAWLFYPPVYYLAGRLVEPFIIRYYQDPSLNLGLTLPDAGTLMAMQVLRGALFLLAALPLILAWKGSRRGLWLWVGSVIFIQIAAQLMIQAYWDPLGLRIPHTLELLGDSFTQAGVYVLLIFSQASHAIQKIEHASPVGLTGFKPAL